MRTLPALAIALLLVTAGCNGVASPETDPSTVAPDLQNTPTETSEPATTPTQPSNTSLPPGVTPDEDDEVDERAIYVAHNQVLENQSVTWRSQQLRTNTTGAVLGWATRTVWTNGSHQRYEVETGGIDPAAVRMQMAIPEYWTNGSVTTSRIIQSNGSVAVQVQQGGPPGSFANLGAGRTVLEGVLAGTDLQYVGNEQQNGTTLHILAGTADDSRLTLRVMSDGVVRSLIYRVETEINGQEITAVDRFRAYEIGTTTVEQPEWATNATER